MKSGDWQTVEAAFERALALEGNDRQAFLAQFARDHPDLARQLDKLLAADDGGDRELRAPIESALEAFHLDSSDPWIGRQLGPWTITERLAGGGMGAVFLARRSDEHYAQHAAIKVMATQLLATDAIARFKAERQILANLNHPNVARLIDGGSTDEGLPFLVMEYIDGIPVDRYCRLHKLDIDQRLRLFRRICAAVEFAHRNLVVHRDLKPGNILVDHDGNPKLLDFGIAKLLEAGSYNDAFAHTRAGLRVLTPEYASPEQVRGESISIATDVYSLGVLLYRLITGQSPYGKTVSSSQDYERAIVENDPSRPSTVVTLPDTSPQLLEELQTSRRLLRKRLAGDLDNIVLKALQKDPERRYATASALSADIERFLGHHPVEARGDEWSYRAGKFVRRHRRGVALAALSIAVIGVFIAYHLHRLAGERDVTAREAAKAENVASFLVSLFETADPGRSRGETITARVLLDQGARRVEHELADTPAVRAAMQDAMGGAYQGLGLYPESQALLEKALATRRALYGTEHRDVLETTSRVANLANARGNYELAERTYLEALQMSRALNGERHAVTATLLAGLGHTLHEMGRHADAGQRYEAAVSIFDDVAPGGSAAHGIALHGYGWLLTDTARFAEAEDQLTRSIDMLKATLGGNHPELPVAMNHLTHLYIDTGRWDDAERTIREVLALSTAIYGDEHPQINGDRQTLATILERMGHYAEAEQQYRLALESDIRLLGDKHPHVAMDTNNLAGVVKAQGRFMEAERLYRESLAINQLVHGRDHPETATSLSNLGVLMTRLGRFEEAEQHFEEALDIRRTQLGEDHPATSSSLHTLANQFALLEDFDRALPLYEETLAIRRRVLGITHPHVASVLANYARLLRDLGRLDEAMVAAKESLAIAEAANAAGLATAAEAVQVMASIAQQAGSPDEALGLYRDALARYAALPTPRDLPRAEVLTSLGGFLVENHSAAEALPLLEEAVSIWEKKLPPGNWEIGITRSALGACQAALGQPAARDNLLLGRKILVDSLGPQHSQSRRAIARVDQYRTALPN